MRTPPTGQKATRPLAAGLFVAATVLWATAPAFADCAVTDPSCIQSTVSGASGTAGDAVKSASDTAAGAADQAPGALNDVVDTVKQTVGGPGPDPGPGGGGSGEGPRSGSGGNSTSNRGSTAPGPGVRFGRIGVRGGVGLVAPPSPPAERSISHRGLFGLIGTQAIRLAKGLAFPALLAVIVVLFMLLQNRIDRRDPKLALAPLAPDVLRFE